MDGKMQIHRSGHVSDSNGNQFYARMTGLINEYQMAGLSVEIQYQQSLAIDGMALFSAVIIGRK